MMHLNSFDEQTDICRGVSPYPRRSACQRWSIKDIRRPKTGKRQTRSLGCKVWSLWVTGRTKSTMTNNNNANFQVCLQQQWCHPSSITEALMGSLYPLAKLWYYFVHSRREVEERNKRAKTFPHLPRTCVLEYISASAKCLLAVCAHLPESVEGHLIGRGFPYLPPASGNLKYITRLAEHYFKSLGNR